MNDVNFTLQVLHRWATPVNQLRSQTHRALREYLKDTKISYSSHYGALSAMIALGPEVLEDCLIPQMEEYIKTTKEKITITEEEQLASVASLNKRDAGFYENQKKKVILNLMWGTLLTASRSILSYYSRNFRKILRNTDFSNANSLNIKIKQENGVENDGLESRLPVEDYKIIDSHGHICISKVYEFLYEQFGSALSILYSDPSRFKNKRSKKSIAKDTRGKQYHSSYKRFGNFHPKSLSRNPLECIGRMRIRILGKNNVPYVNEFDKATYLNVKQETDEHSAFSHFDAKSYGDEKNIYQPRPTSSTSSDADFNYLAGCGLPTDIFEPVTSENNTNSNNPQIFQRANVKSKESQEADTCLIISPNVIKSFEIITNKSESNSAKSLTTISNIRYRRINFAFGTSQWPKEKLRRKHFTSSLVARHQNCANEVLISKGHTPKIILGKRMGTPRGVTTNCGTVVYSCTLMSII